MHIGQATMRPGLRMLRSASRTFRGRQEPICSRRKTFKDEPQAIRRALYLKYEEREAPNHVGLPSLPVRKRMRRALQSWHIVRADLRFLIAGIRDVAITAKPSVSPSRQIRPAAHSRI